jgi:hypothetical protein
VVFSGPAEAALNYFNELPSFHFDLSLYMNPADFLTDVSACTAKSDKVCILFYLIDTSLMLPSISEYIRRNSIMRSLCLIPCFSLCVGR